MSSLGRKLHRRQIQRSKKLWNKLTQRGQKHGYACLTCEKWLGLPLDDQEERRRLFAEHQRDCPHLMISSLDRRPKVTPKRPLVVAQRLPAVHSVAQPGDPPA